MWYDHQFLRLRDTFAKKSKAWQKCASFSRFTDLCGKKSKNKKCRNMGTQCPTFLHFSFFENFFSKFVKREKLAHFWHGLLKKRVNE